MPLTNIPLPQRVKVELSADLLEHLIIIGLVKGCDCKCLDIHAKQVLWKSLLNSSVQG